MSEVNIIYKPHKGQPSLHYTGPEGRIWMHNKERAGAYNIGMSYYSSNGRNTNAIYVIEPRCVLEQDYNTNFVKKFDKIFTWAVKGFDDEVSDKIIELNHPSCRNHLSVEQLKKNHVPWEKRKDEIIFIANNKSSRHPSQLYTLRVLLADKLSKHFKVKWYGQMPLKRPYYHGKLPNKNTVLSQARFTICTENSYAPKWSHNYLTEKMPEAWLSGAVPIYMGCYNIDDFGFAKESYIDLRPIVAKEGKKHKVDFNKLVDTIKSFNKQKFDTMTEAVFENMAKPKGLFYHISSDRVYKKMLESAQGNK